MREFLIKMLLSPFALLYGIGVSLRNSFYNHGILKEATFNIPTISVGNLSVGGAGKSPHIEYLIDLLNPYLEVATLSRGYKRKTRGYLEVHPDMRADQSGDEPLQFKRKYRDVTVAVCESRTLGIMEIVKYHPRTQVVLLDDAFQHRAVKPGINILLTEYDHPFTDDSLLPAGRLREWKSSYERADIIIVSKCPAELSEAERDAFLQKISARSHQRVFFSYYAYGTPYYIFNPRYRLPLTEEWDTILVSAIARTDYLMQYLEPRVKSVHAYEFADHHFFSKFDVSTMKKKYDNFESDKKVLLTTEKDATRLQLHQPFLVEQRLPIFALPVQVKFHFGEGAEFDDLIKKWLLRFKG